MCGLIDLSDVSWGDPVLDFTVLPGWLGADATRTVLESYSPAIDDGFVDRLRFSCRLVTIKWLHDAHLRGGNLHKHRLWIRRAFEF